MRQNRFYQRSTSIFKNSTKRRRGVTLGEELHQYNLKLVLRGRISTLGSNSTLHARLTYPPGRPQWKIEGVHGSAFQIESAVLTVELGSKPLDLLQEPSPQWI